jgi:hypothetical protein
LKTPQKTTNLLNIELTTEKQLEVPKKQPTELPKSTDLNATSRSYCGSNAYSNDDSKKTEKNNLPNHQNPPRLESPKSTATSRSYYGSNDYRNPPRLHAPTTVPTTTPTTAPTTAPATLQKKKKLNVNNNKIKKIKIKINQK